MKAAIVPYRPFLNSVINSYSQVFFSDSRPFAIILLIVSFIDPNAGLAGLVSVIISNLTAWLIGLNRLETEKGFYGFNSLLVGLGIGYFFKSSIELYLIIVTASILTLMFVTLFRGILQKYGLPYLSIPFLFGIWTVLLASDYFASLGISQKGIYTLNILYGMGGSTLVNLYEQVNGIHLGFSLETYFKSIGAIFFQFSTFAGMLIAIGLLIFSRIAFLLSFYGFYIAFLFYRFLGGNIAEMSYTYIGFNYILTAIAVGGFFMIPSKKTFFWLLILIPIVTMITLSLSGIFSTFHLSIYALPFNIVVLLFLYLMKFRLFPSPGLTEVFYQQNSPEKNLYSFYNQKNNALHRKLVHFRLPFHGRWTVLQGHNGEYTHKDEWQHAWDFVVTGEDGRQFRNKGDFPQDYFCFGKSVLAPAAGTVTEIRDNIADNDIGNVNLHNNWGNSVIIKHDEYLYSSLNHLKSGSVCVKEGENVSAGQKIGETGNSGRSAYPHLHMQFQSAPYIGSKTIDYPLGYYILPGPDIPRLKTFERPEKDQVISNIDSTYLLKKALRFMPGRILNVTWHQRGKQKNTRWEVFTTIYNTSYIYEKNSDSYAWFVNDDAMLYFTHFSGNRSSMLYLFYLAMYRVLQGYYQDLRIRDELPQDQTFKFPLLSFQDFIAPFWIFLRTDYKLNYVQTDNELQPSEIILLSEMKRKIVGHILNERSFHIRITEDTTELKMTSGKDETLVEIS